MKTAVVLVNIGTPNSPEPSDVGDYLNQFLMDPDVISLPYLLRWLLVHVLIVPRRKHVSSHAYKKIWTERGSPLLTITEDLVEGLGRGGQSSQLSFHLGMRYGKPNIEMALSRCREADQIVILPMFPQYADATTASLSAECRRVAEKLGLQDRLSFLPEFYTQPQYIDSLVNTIQKEKSKFDYLLFSYHGLPQSHIIRADRSSNHCLKKSSCCEKLEAANGKCYRAQCFATTRAVVEKLELSGANYSVSFQSRLGRSEWVRPYTDETVRDLAARGVKRLGIVCPAFLIDCLETLEEVAIGLREQFIASGGEELVLVPCLNAEPVWTQHLRQWIDVEVEKLTEKVSASTS